MTICIHPTKTTTHIIRSNCPYGQGCNANGKCELLCKFFGATYDAFLGMEWSFTCILNILTILWMILMVKNLMIHASNHISDQYIVQQNKYEKMKQIFKFIFNYSHLQINLNAVGGVDAIANLSFLIVMCVMTLVVTRDPQAYGGILTFCQNWQLANTYTLFFVFFTLNVAHSLFEAIVGNSKIDTSIKHTVAKSILKHNQKIKYFSAIFITIITIASTIVTCDNFNYWKSTTLWWMSVIFLCALYLVIVSVIVYFLRKHLLKIENFEKAAMNKNSASTKRIRTLYHILICFLIILFICLLYTFNILYDALKNKVDRYPQATDSTSLFSTSFFHIFKVILSSGVLIRFIIALSAKTSTASSSSIAGGKDNHEDNPSSISTSSSPTAKSNHISSIHSNTSNDNNNNNNVMINPVQDADIEIEMTAGAVLNNQTTTSSAS